MSEEIFSGTILTMLTRDPVRTMQPAPLAITRAPRSRVLVDLSHASDGYVGIAQDLRLIFGMLSEIESIELSGLMMPASRHDLPYIGPGAQDAAALTAAVLHCMERNWHAPERRPFPFRIPQRAQMLRQFLRTRHQLLPLADRGQLNALWRVLFAKTLSPAQRLQVLEQSFYATDLSVSNLIDRCVQPPFPMLKKLDASHFNAVLFCMPRPVKLPRGVRQLIRFHDSVPVTDTDTVVGWKSGLAHSRLVRACAKDAIFVCNSPQSLESLVTLDPSREERAVVIPCAVAPADRNLDGIDLTAVIERHVTFRSMGPGITTPPPGWARPEPGMRYVLSVSTLEPRKNFPGLIRAWERAAVRSAPGLRLIIVGGPGWREEPMLTEMRPGVESGRILHLQNLPRDELQALMRGAVCYAFPSFNEGFGFSPLEAMQVGTPCVVSDLPVFRWIFGDAALYVDPYDVESIAGGLERLTGPAAPPELPRTLRVRGEKVLARFRPASIRHAWQTMLETKLPAA